jgi:hypothetical protein
MWEDAVSSSLGSRDAGREDGADCMASDVGARAGPWHTSHTRARMGGSGTRTLSMLLRLAVDGELPTNPMAGADQAVICLYDESWCEVAAVDAGT